MEFQVEGRYFPDPLQAFTFAQIQADRMGRPVEVHIRDKYDNLEASWHATAYPPNHVRAHIVKQPPGLIASAA